MKPGGSYCLPRPCGRSHPLVSGSFNHRRPAWPARSQRRPGHQQLDRPYLVAGAPTHIDASGAGPAGAVDDPCSQPRGLEQTGVACGRQCRRGRVVYETGSLGLHGQCRIAAQDACPVVPHGPDGWGPGQGTSITIRDSDKAAWLLKRGGRNVGSARAAADCVRSSICLVNGRKRRLAGRRAAPDTWSPMARFAAEFSSMPGPITCFHDRFEE